jgi:inward rectifier potassium channel
MHQPTFDPGLTQKYTGKLNRSLEENGEFNVRRTGITLRDRHPYLYLIGTTWTNFIGVVFLLFVAVNLGFAWLYVSMGIEYLKGAGAPTKTAEFVNAFFFSTHTLTTVGYGNIYPVGPWANLASAFEALIGLLGFAVITGLMFGRFSRPSARIGYSENMLVTPYEDGTSLQFRIVNRRSNNILELNARVLLMTVELCDGKLQRKFAELKLERTDVLFLALTWTIVHPIDATSPLYGVNADDLERMQAEVLVLIKGFDETFGQVVHTRRSYVAREIIWGARFVPAFDVEENGDLRLDTGKVGDFEPVPLPRLN